jgi:hypothetical protein
MLRTFAVALLAIAMSVGLAQAKGHRQRTPLCAVNQQATATCLCGVALTGQPVLCQKGQWCHGWEMRGMRVCTP